MSRDPSSPEPPSRPDLVLAELDRHESFVLSSHDSPDGDAIGSELGMRALLDFLGKRTTIINPSPMPPALRFLAGAADVRVWPEGRDTRFDAFVSVDAGQRSRLEPVDSMIHDGQPFVNIDHHEGNDEFGTVNWCDPAYGSNGEMVYDLLRQAGCPIEAPVAEALYVAVLTDTGSFGYSNTGPSAHRMAEALLSAGVRPERVHHELFRRKTISRMNLEAEAIQGMQVAGGGRVAWCVVDPAAIARAGATEDETRDLVHIPASLEGVELALSFRDLGDASGTRVSLRSKTDFRVNRFAERYAGGGHPKAAGFRLAEPAGPASRRVIDDLLAALGDPAESAGSGSRREPAP